jgi:uncharacterized protein YbjQ (UPF0145 family)
MKSPSTFPSNRRPRSEDNKRALQDMMLFAEELGATPITEMELSPKE